MKLHTNGHDFNEKAIVGELTRRHLFHIQRDEERIAQGEKALNIPASGSYDCARCGVHIGFEVSPDGSEATIDYMSKWPEPNPLKAESLNDHSLVHLDLSTKCLPGKVEPVKIQFECKSGKLILGNDFRTALKTEDRLTPYWMYKGVEGDRQYITHRAKHGRYLTGLVGNTGIDFVANGNGIDVVEGWYDTETDEYRPSIHHVSLELWWFQIVDAADFPKRGKDSFDRKPGVYTLPEGPGMYEFTCDLVGSEKEDGKPFVWATLRKIG